MIAAARVGRRLLGPPEAGQGIDSEVIDRRAAFPAECTEETGSVRETCAPGRTLTAGAPA